MIVRPPIQITLDSGENMIANPEGPAIDKEVCSYYLKQPESGDPGTVVLGEGFSRSTTRPLRLSSQNGKTDFFSAAYNEASAKWVVGRFIGGLNV